MEKREFRLAGKVLSGEDETGELMEKRGYRLAGKTWPEGGERGKHREECEF